MDAAPSTENMDNADCLLYGNWYELGRRQAGGSSTTGAVWLLPSLRTDSVNRGFCISLFTLEIVVLAVSLGFFFFLHHPQNIDMDCAQNLFSIAHNSVSTEVMRLITPQSCWHSTLGITNSAMGKSGICWIWFRRQPHFRRNHHLKQRGGATNVSRDGDECVGYKGMLVRQQVKTVTHVVEFLSFLQNCSRRHMRTRFPVNLRRGQLQVG